MSGLSPLRLSRILGQEPPDLGYLSGWMRQQRIELLPDPLHLIDLTPHLLPELHVGFSKPGGFRQDSLGALEQSVILHSHGSCPVTSSPNASCAAGLPEGRAACSPPSIRRKGIT